MFFSAEKSLRQRRALYPMAHFRRTAGWKQCALAIDTWLQRIEAIWFFSFAFGGCKARFDTLPA
jgi:hypothetical protein